MIDLTKIKQELEEFGWHISINRNQNENGTLNQPWMRGCLTINTDDFTHVNATREMLNEFIDDIFSIEAELPYSTKKITILFSYFPNMNETNVDLDDCHIVPCYIPCPKVSA